MEASKDMNIKIVHQLHKVGRLQRRTRKANRGMDATRGQGRVLALLGLKPEISQKDLTFLLGMRQQSVAELLMKLEEKGFIEREQATEDRRQMLVKLTEAGREEAARIDTNPKASFLDCLEDDEKETLSGYLTRLIEALEEEVGDGEDDLYEMHRKHFEEMFDGEVPEGFPERPHGYGHGGHGSHGHGHGGGRGHGGCGPHGHGGHGGHGGPRGRGHHGHGRDRSRDGMPY